MKRTSRILAVAMLSAALAACGGAKDETSSSGGETATPATTEAAVTDAAATDTAATDAAATDTAAATGAGTTTEAAAVTTAANAAPKAFAICKTCHSVEPGKNMIGPSLAGIYGTKAGDVAGYQFSPAMKNSGLTWDDATLDKWLDNPMKLVPGTKMTYAGQHDAAKRAEIIAYLKTLK